MSENIARSALVAELYSEFNDVSGLSKALLARIVAAYEEKIMDHVANGDKVTLSGFAKLESQIRAAREARNPQTGKSIKVPEKRVPRIVALKTFKDKVAK